MLIYTISVTGASATEEQSTGFQYFSQPLVLGDSLIGYSNTDEPVFYFSFMAEAESAIDLSVILDLGLHPLQIRNLVVESQRLLDAAAHGYELAKVVLFPDGWLAWPDWRAVALCVAAWFALERLQWSLPTVLGLAGALGLALRSIA